MIEAIKFKQEEVYDRLKADILAGRLKEASQLPKEVDFAKSLGVARGTLRNVLDMLENDGLIVRLRSKGTFVKPREQRSAIKKILILLNMDEKADISCPSNYIMPGIENAEGKEIITEVCPLQFIKDMDVASGVKFLEKADPHGAIIFGGRFTGQETYIRMLQKLGRPVVMASCYPQDTLVTGFAAVRTNRKKAWEDGILFLKEKGHRHIATLTHKFMQGYEEDFSVYKKFLESEKIYRPELIKITNYNYEEISEALKNLMRLEQPPTAVMCYSDYYAMHLLSAAKEQEIRIPENLAVMGYSGFQGAEYLEPPLATVDFHYPEIGKTAIDILERSSEWFNTAEKISPPDLVIRHDIVARKSVLTERRENVFQS